MAANFSVRPILLDTLQSLRLSSEKYFAQAEQREPSSAQVDQLLPHESTALADDLLTREISAQAEEHPAQNDGAQINASICQTVHKSQDPSKQVAVKITNPEMIRLHPKAIPLKVKQISRLMPNQEF